MRFLSFADILESLALVDAMLPRLQTFSSVERVVCPPFTSLPAVAARLGGTEIGVGAQNMYPEPKGAFTGEISPIMLQELARYVILGHSERRQYFNEDDALINRKLKAALGHGLVPIVCVSGKLTNSRQSSTLSLIASGGISECSCRKNATFSATVRESKSAPF